MQQVPKNFYIVDSGTMRKSLSTLLMPVLFTVGFTTACRTTAQVKQKVDSTIVAEKMDSKLLHDLSSSDSLSTLSIEIDGKISDSLISFLTKLGVAKLRSFPQFNQATCEVRRSHLPLIARRKDIRFIRAAPTPQLER